MNSRDLARLMFVGLGVICLIYAIAMFSSIALVFSLDIQDGLPRILSFAAPLLPLVCFGWLAAHLIRYRVRYSEHLFPEPQTRTGGLSADDLHIVGLSLVGVFLVVSALPGFVRYAFSVAGYVYQAVSERSVVTGDFAPPSAGYSFMLEELLASAGRLALGVVLVLTPRKLTSFLLHRHEQKDVPTPEKLACPDCGHAYSPSDYREDVDAIYCSKCRRQLTGVQQHESE